MTDDQSRNQDATTPHAGGCAASANSQGRPLNNKKHTAVTSRSNSPKSQLQSPSDAAVDEYFDGEAAEQYPGGIEPGGPEHEEDGEFSLNDIDDDTSITSSVHRHTFKNGRRYHKFRHGRYPIPNDEREQNREDMLHAMMLEATGGRHFFAPITAHPSKILDLGTGTGIWAIEVADMYPGAEVTGVDLSPIQPEWTPPNVRFLVDDMEDTWLAGDRFDFVHLRNVVPILKSPVAVLKNIFTNLKPGGWVELQDVDGKVHTDDASIPLNWPLSRFCDLMAQCFAAFGTDANAAERGRAYMEEAGFVNVRHHAIKLPYGPWARDRTLRVVGMYYRIACEEMFPVVGVMHLPMLGWSQDEAEVLFAGCRAAMRDPKVHAYGLMHFWSGQKPEEG
ncbi:S-adenosyl-L-methionine-dependent methyltransferase [Lasiosphaeria hispida]|uniref:S-adenosyl-L-methionine-dependent methyltransferase n=1 Tax=Lasiosphaeria hispida TaxID=260671 RepID=A0AAJ0HA48_9PEZI|nr:S-adenosyl-L-methionine-dependent methyltransferase [Lasiosphaeria hispida]